MNVDLSVDELIEMKRQQENLFGIIKDIKSRDYVSFPLVEGLKEVELKEVELKKDKENEKPIVKIDYCRERLRNLTICEWRIKLALGMDWKIPWKLKKWADEKIERKGHARTDLFRMNENETPPELSLFVVGSGHDNRCTWCRSFWTAFMNTSKDKSFEIDRSKICRFVT